MDRLGDLYLKVAVEPDLHGVERIECDVHLQAVPENVAAVDDLDVVALWLSREKERVSECFFLEQESMVSGDENVRGVGAGQLLHEIDDVAQGVLDGLEDLALSARLVSGGVNAIVVDVQDPIGFVKFPTLVCAQCLEVLGLDRRTAHALKDFSAKGSSIGGLVVHQHGLRIRRMFQRRMRKQRCHSQLRVARQHAEYCVK